MRVILSFRCFLVIALALTLCAGCANRGAEAVAEQSQDSSVRATAPNSPARTATNILPAQPLGAEAPDKPQANATSVASPESPLTAATNVLPAQPLGEAETSAPQWNADAEKRDTANWNTLNMLPAQPMEPAEPPRPCLKATAEDIENWLNLTRYEIYETVCGAIAWFDGFFGNPRYELGGTKTYGRISTSMFWDERNGFEPNVRFRAKYALPTLKRRTRLIVERGNQDEILQDREIQTDTIPGAFNEVDDDLLVGLGYRRNKGLKRGFDFSSGVKVRSTPELYSKAKYARAWELTDTTLFRLNPIVYWKSEEGFGSTLRAITDQLLTDTVIMRWTNTVNASEEEEVEGFALSSALQFYQALPNRKALNYRAFFFGQTRADVKWQNYGFEVRYRQRILRKWLFLELISTLTWPRFQLDEDRESNVGVGAGLQMFFGPVPDDKLR